MHPRMRALGAVAAALLFAAATGSGSSAAQGITMVHARVVPAVQGSLSAVQFLSQNDGWVSGCSNVLSDGTRTGCFLLSTTSGGARWNQTQTGPVAIEALDFLTAQSGFLVGVEGRHIEVLRTYDRGRSLSTLANLLSPVPAADLSHAPTIHAFSPNSAYLSFGTSLVTTGNGFRTFTLHKGPGAPLNGYQSDSIVLRSLTLGYGLSGGTIYRTTNGGGSWQSVFQVPKVLTSYLGAAYASGITLSGSTGWASISFQGCWAGGCPGAIAVTRDGGTDWQVESVSNMGAIPGWKGPMSGPGGGVTSLQSTDPHTVVVNTMYGLSVSADAGQTWSFVPADQIEPSGGEIAFDYVPGAGIYALGSAPNGDYLIHEQRVGANWQQLFPGIVPLSSVDFVSAGVGFGIGLPWLWQNSALLRTTDGGATWSLVNASLPPNVQAMSFANSEDGLIALSSPAKVLVTVDGGAHWRPVATSLTGIVAMFGGGQGVVAPERLGTILTGRLFRLSGGTLRQMNGIHWPVPVGSTRMDEALTFTSPTTGWLGTLSQGRLRLYRTTDGAVSWRRIAVPSHLTAVPNTLQISGSGKDAVWVAVGPLSAVGSGAEILKTSDGGGTWTLISIPISVRWGDGPSDFSAVGNESAWLISQGTTYRTADGGRVWTPASGF